MTNSSLAVSSASLTHLIKMSEPVFTSFILAALGRIVINCDLVLIMFSVVISAIGSEPLSSVPASIVGVIFSVGSNLCFALRNIGTKYFTEKDSSSPSKTTLAGFASMSLVGFVVMLPSLLTVLLCTPHHLNYHSQDLLVSSLCHAVYNIVSLTLVLAVFSPVQHSLLNVGKRISIVIALYVFSQRVLSPVNIVSGGLCLLVCVSGVRAVREQEETRGANYTKYWAGILVR